MKVIFTPEGLAVTAGPFIFIPNHLTKALVALSVALMAGAYSVKEFGNHRYEQLLDDSVDHAREEIRNQQLEEETTP